MQNYTTVPPMFWTGPVARAMRALDDPSAAFAVAFHLYTAPACNLIGLYHLPAVLVAHALGLPVERVLSALADLDRAGFARYDRESEMVWVIDVASHVLGSQGSKPRGPRQTIKADDRRHDAIIRELEHHRASPFFAPFVRLYGAPLRLPAEWIAEVGPEAKPASVARLPR